ncbi:MAG TPA: hypothetical protein VFH15_14270 [Pyrinomonadaceae bacterium]|nr:hypothetical protein [Pyrinomonadaceae bacterium]
MNSSVSAQTQSPRTLVETVEREFVLLDSRTRDLLQKIPKAMLYQPTTLPGITTSVGEVILKSAGAVEQTCGGLNANLWDDPFEWTLPETLSTPALVNEYLDEVAQTREAFFARLKADEDLKKFIAVPGGSTQPLIQVLLETLLRASGNLERAAVILAATTNAEVE